MPYLNPAVLEHPRILDVSRSARGVWLLSVCYLDKWQRHLPDLRFPRAVIYRFGATRRDIQQLTTQGLWVREGAEILVPQELPNRLGEPITLWRYASNAPYRSRIPDDVRRAVYERDGHACLHCGATEPLTLDHIVPWSQGGEDAFENLQTLCLRCNASKGARV